ncbi:MAG: MBL fold metallo-hydrolase [Gammaproteobacteria bacterium]|nr:MBL fold metallo-hydrolase [Gammaproteobacteria bacterium]
MKCLHRADLYGWSQFNEDRNIDFHSVLWVRPDGNVAVDPLPLSAHDQEHLQQVGGAAWIVVTNSDHVRDAEELAQKTRAKLAGPSAGAANFPIRCDRWLEDGEEVVPGLKVFELEGSKTAGELALLLEGSTLIVGDLVRVHEGGRLCVLPDAKLFNKAKAIASIQRLVDAGKIDAVLTGDGWPIFRDGNIALVELLSKLGCEASR